MKKTAIIINGGKDTLCDFVSKHIKIKKISSIAPILKIAKAGGWNGNKDDKSRKLLSDLKHLFTKYNGFIIQLSKKSDRRISSFRR